MNRAVMCGLLILVMVLIAAAFLFPLEATTGYRCPYCGATAYRQRYLFIPMPLRVREGVLTRYWRAHVDPSHEHVWIPRSTNENWGKGRHSDHPGNFVRWWLVEDRMMVTVLRCLPTRAARKVFVERLWEADSGSSKRASDRAGALIWDIRNCYLENPKRADWPKIMKAHGAWPAP